MKDLLPYYEEELSRLRTASARFAQEYPRIAGRLMLGPDLSEDPHVERLIESFALLSARVHKRLDDDFPLFTETFLDVLYPHYLRPLPSCSVAQVDTQDAWAQMTTVVRLPRGTQLTSHPVRGVSCTFRTAFDVDLLPLRIASVQYRPSVTAPQGTRIPRGATSMLSLDLELMAPQMHWDRLDTEQLRIYLDGEASLVCALREALSGHCRGMLLQTEPVGPWTPAGDTPIQTVGFASDENLIDYDARSHEAYRLLTEYFAFPEKFNFLDLQLPLRRVRQLQARRFTLHLMLGDIRSDSHDARLLESAAARNFRLGCTPVVNLVSRHADPIRVTRATATYPVLPEGRRAHAYEVYSIDKVFRVTQGPDGEGVEELRPFYSLRHDDTQDESNDAGRYWHAHRDESLAEMSPGYEFGIGVVDSRFNPALPETETLSIEVTATNRDLPSLLSFGQQGELEVAGGGLAKSFTMLRRPTRSYRFETGRGALWRLISHLSLNHLSLSAGGIDALREMLRLYDLPRSATNRRQIDGLVAIDFQPTTAWMEGNPFPTFVRGTEVRLSVDEDSFVGIGLRLVTQVLDHFFGLYVHANSFTQLRVLSARSQETLILCPPRNGSSPLV